MCLDMISILKKKMAHMLENLHTNNERQQSRRRFFIYAPPLKGVRKSRRKPPKPPFKGAAAWQNSVYYYWWEYLRRHDGYKQTCLKGGRGKYSALYKDFGDVHNGSFWEWWRHRQELFCEPPPPYARIVVLNDVYEQPNDTVLIQISLEQRLALSLRQIKRQLTDLVKVRSRQKTPSKAKYPVYTKPVLSNLHRCLMIWDAKNQNPHWNNFLIKDYVDGKLSRDDIEIFITSKEEKIKNKIGGSKEDRIDKTYSVSRDLRIAQQYIDNVVLGEFPKRSGR